ncbi:MAG: MBL fold metallo-hydrolase [Planctomycetales bacterium]
MKLAFLGTRGEIEARTRAHGMHTSLLVAYRGRRVMIDCGADWLGKIPSPAPHAIVVTHAHPDHAWGLQEGAPCPVHATAVAWREMEKYPIAEKRTVEPRRPFDVAGIAFEAFPVAHSTRCPAVGYRVSAGKAAIFYVPDVVFIEERAAALAGVKLFIGDGASIARSFVRKRGDALIGHAPVRTQLGWCEKEGVSNVIITHCGSEIVRDHAAAERQIRELGEERGLNVRLAYDGLEVTLR